ncbi:MAG: metalloregulator ArsR/SmtB family transcription factor [Thiomonas sp.]|nr:metalloregulator ArsR/SmtB family transcription factor [Thiomonas sp.]
MTTEHPSSVAGHCVAPQLLNQIAQTFSACTPLFFALGEMGRQQILLLLTQDAELNVKQLAQRLPLSRPAISHHLKILRQAGLVTVRQAGVENYYALSADNALRLLKQFVAEIEASC